MKKLPVTIFLMITAIFILFTSVKATDITACGSIDYPGNYTLTANITGTSVGSCLVIASGVNDVNLNLNGYKIGAYNSGDSSTNIGLLINGNNNNINIYGGVLSGTSTTTYGYFASKIFSNSNVTISNTTIEVSGYGIYCSGSSFSSLIINNVTFKCISSSNICYHSINGCSTFDLSVYNSKFFSMGYSNFRAPENSGVFVKNHFNLTATQLSYLVGSVMNNSLIGNYYSNPSGTGYSQACTDANSNGICDSQLNISSTAIDYLPIANISFLNSFSNVSNETTPLCVSGDWSCLGTSDQYIVCTGGKWLDFNGSVCDNSTFYGLYGTCNCNVSTVCNETAKACVSGDCEDYTNVSNCGDSSFWSTCSSWGSQYCLSCLAVTRSCTYGGVVIPPTNITILDKWMSEWSMTKKMLVAVVSILVLDMTIALILAGAGAVLAVPVFVGVASVLLVCLFSILGFIPIWILIVLAILVVGVVLIKLFGGGA